MPPFPIACGSRSQVAPARRRLARRFPDVADATSVEVWCHRRPRDGEHRLHCDMDEILLWERRRREEGGKRR